MAIFLLLPAESTINLAMVIGTWISYWHVLSLFDLMNVCNVWNATYVEKNSSKLQICDCHCQRTYTLNICYTSTECCGKRNNEWDHPYIHYHSFISKRAAVECNSLGEGRMIVQQTPTGSSLFAPLNDTDLLNMVVTQVALHTVMHYTVGNFSIKLISNLHKGSLQAWEVYQRVQETKTHLGQVCVIGCLFLSAC